MRRLSDDELIERILSGDHARYQELVSRYKRTVVDYCRFRVTRTHLADELAEETFVRTYKELQRFGQDTRVFSGRLLAIGATVCEEHLRKAGVGEGAKAPLQTQN